MAKLSLRFLLVGLAIHMVMVPSSQARTLLKEKSLYQTLIVTETKGLRCLKFSVRRDQRNQSCMDVSKPQRLVFTYARMMFATLLFQPNPERILVVGLGGGTLPVALHQLFPLAHIDVVELDPAVVEVAEEHFGYVANAKLNTHTLDARVFTKRLGLSLKRLDPVAAETQRYDIIMLDAFNGEYIPEHLMTREFFQETAAILREGGVVATNTFNYSKLYDHESVTFETVFGPFLNYKLPQTANRVMIGRKNATLDISRSRSNARSNAKLLNPRLRPYDVNLLTAIQDLTTKRDWKTQSRVLTDQYNPVNLLRKQKR